MKLMVSVSFLLILLVACQSIESRNNEANQYYKDGLYSEALLSYQAAQVRASDKAILYINQSHSYVSVQDYDKAIESLEQAIQRGTLEEKNIAYYNLAIVYEDLGNIEQAIAAYKNAILSKPSDDQSRHNLERLLNLFRATPTAIEIKIEPEDSQANPSETPTPNPAGQDGPTPTPPPIAVETDLSASPESDTEGEFNNATPMGTPRPHVGGTMSVEEANEILDTVNQDRPPLGAYQNYGVTPGANPNDKDW
ncbi:hypothetical protein MASR2M15_16540 [Anaerolineales bacterium]